MATLFVHLISRPFLSRHTAGVLLILLGAAVFALGLLVRERRVQGDQALRPVETLLFLLAGICFALGHRFLRD